MPSLQTCLAATYEALNTAASREVSSVQNALDAVSLLLHALSAPSSVSDTLTQRLIEGGILELLKGVVTGTPTAYEGLHQLAWVASNAM